MSGLTQFRLYIHSEEGRCYLLARPQLAEPCSSCSSPSLRAKSPAFFPRCSQSTDAHYQLRSPCRVNRGTSRSSNLNSQANTSSDNGRLPIHILDVCISYIFKKSSNPNRSHCQTPSINEDISCCPSLEMQESVPGNRLDQSLYLILSFMPWSTCTE